jgi:glutamyl-Q tRNA(Asp) synthetase
VSSSTAVENIPRYRGRFAPSPTGPLHFGSLIAAVASYCDARANQGEWLVRIEDVDQPRSRIGAADAILFTLESYGFEWDGPIVRQSERTALYQAALDHLVCRDLAFACSCTRGELALASRGIGGEHVYPGTCRAERRNPPRLSAAWRAVVADHAIAYHDRNCGRQEQRLAAEVGDFIVRRSDGLFAYQLAVVVDDADQGITHVVRGSDLLDSTPRQILLQRYLEVATPTYLHHAVAVDAVGNKLSKSTFAARLPDTALPALLAAWLFLGQHRPPREMASIAEFWQWAHAQWDTRRLSANATAGVPSAIAGAV